MQGNNTLTSIILVLALVGFAVTLQGPTAQGYVHHTQTTFVLSKHIYFGWDYEELIRTLNNAEPGDKINIILDSNQGGSLYSAQRILKAMRNTKAKIYTYVEGWASSAALDIFLAGDIITIPKHVIGLAHLSSNCKGSDFYLIPMFIYFKDFMTVQEWESFTNDGDVMLYGKVMCRIVKHKISDTVSKCVVRWTMR